jgi:hypothetical protein
MAWLYVLVVWHSVHTTSSLNAGFATVLTNMDSAAAGRKGAFTEAAASLKKLDDRGAIVLFAEDLARKREARK